jgi:hypothetical protein
MTNIVLMILRSMPSALWSGETGRYGDFITEPITNYDNDEYWNDSRLDIYIKWRADNPGLGQKITDTNRISYSWETEVYYNISDGTAMIDYYVSTSDNQRPAMWIYEDMLRAFEFWINNAYFDPGPVTTIWEDQVEGGTGFYCCSDPRVVIGDDNADSKDIVIHEIAHNYLYNMYQEIVGDSCPSPHNMFIESNIYCAWREGWAEFLPLIVNGDQCFDWGLGPCDEVHENLETHNMYDPPIYQRGEAVEGRVAGALYDLEDNTNENYDATSFPFSYITSILAEPPVEYHFLDFWFHWFDHGYDHHDELRSSFFLNTIGSTYIYLPMIVK